MTINAPATTINTVVDLEGSLAELDTVLSFMSTDKSNDWTEEIATLQGIEQNSRAVLAELRQMREEVETWRANLGAVADVVDTSRFARLGRQTAATLGANLEWECADITSDLSTFWSQIASPAIGGQNPEDLKHWRALADRLGIRHDGDDD